MIRRLLLIGFFAISFTLIGCGAEKKEMPKAENTDLKDNKQKEEQKEENVEEDEEDSSKGLPKVMRGGNYYIEIKNYSKGDSTSVTMEYKLWIDGDKYRQSSFLGDKKGFASLSLDAGKTEYTWMEGNLAGGGTKGNSIQPYGVFMGNLMQDKIKEIVTDDILKKSGTENVAGVSCEVYEGNVANISSKYYVDTKNNIVMKYEQGVGLGEETIINVFEITKFEKGGAKPSDFELPKGVEFR